MADNNEKQFRKALKVEVAPLLIVLRNEIKALTKQIKKAEEARPEIQKTELTNPAEIQKVEQTNPQEEVTVKNFPDEVKLAGLKDLLLDVQEMVERSGKSRHNALTKLFSGLTRAIKTEVFRVKVENQVKFPDIIKVEEQNPTKQAEVQRVQIENSTPDQSIPVRLVSKDGKRFYEVLTILAAAGRAIGERDKPRPGLAVDEFLKSAGSPDMNVDGSVTPVTFSAVPPTGKKWFIHSVVLIMEDASINFTKFGGIAGGITNGIDIKVREGGLAERLLGNFKTNGDLHTFTIDVRIDSAATDLLTLRTNIKQTSGTTFELKDVDSDVFKVIVNDDLTSINRFNVLIKGFEVNE